MSTYLGSPEKIERVLARMAAKRADEAICRHFADTPLYLATMIDTHISPRAVWTETEEILTIGEGKIRLLTFVVESDLHEDVTDEP